MARASDIESLDDPPSHECREALYELVELLTRSSSSNQGLDCSIRIQHCFQKFLGATTLPMKNVVLEQHKQMEQLEKRVRQMEWVVANDIGTPPPATPSETPQPADVEMPKEFALCRGS